MFLSFVLMQALMSAPWQAHSPLFLKAMANTLKPLPALYAIYRCQTLTRQDSLHPP